MSHKHDRIESLARSQLLCEPNERLDARIAGELQQAHDPPGVARVPWSARILWATIGAAAAAMIILGAPLVSQAIHRRANDRPTTPVAKPLNPANDKKDQHEQPVESPPKDADPTVDQTIATDMTNEKTQLPPATIRIDRYLVRTVSGELYRHENLPPSRPVRRQIIQQTRWVDENGRVYIREAIPREHITLRPESIQ